MSGPDVGDQLQLLAYSKGIVDSTSYKNMIILHERIEKLKTFSVLDSIEIVNNAIKSRVSISSTTIDP